MPEGPSIVIMKEAMMQFKGKKVIGWSGNTTVEIPDLTNLVVQDLKTWGKHFLICFKHFTIRVHLMLFGTYLINETKEAKPRLHLRFNNGELNFYTVSLQLISGDLNDTYDWTADVMNKKWDPLGAKKKMKATPNMLVCDALMDQQIFSGVGNIIKNEVMFRTRIHPQSRVGALPASKINALLKEVVAYTFDFYQWKKEGTLKKHWRAYGQSTCSRDHTPLIKKSLGRSHRTTYFCNSCQELYK